VIQANRQASLGDPFAFLARAAIGVAALPKGAVVEMDAVMVLPE